LPSGAPSACIRLPQANAAALGNFQPVPPGALLAGTLVYYVINTGMVSAAVALSQRASLWSTWRSGYLWTAPSYLAGAAVVAGAAFLRSRGGDAVAALSLFCLILVYHSYRGYLDRMHHLQVGEARLQEVCLAAVESLALAIDAKDGATHSHIRRVQQIAMALAERAGVTPSELHAIRLASLTHDVGKLAVPDTILAKAGRLTPAEYERVKMHVPVGVSILEPVQFPWPVVDIVRTHHERWDGTGYPAGLQGEETPIGGRIVAIADVFDALTAARPYRKALSYEEAHAVIREGRGTQFDPQLVETFSEIFPALMAALTAADTAGATDGAESPPWDPSHHGRVWSEIRVAAQEARSIAFTDSLTGLANARHLAAALPRELEATQRGGDALSVLMIDLDDFKAINDGHGHLRGDAALQAVARALQESVRGGSTVCRYAGDEFVIVLPGANRDQAVQVAERLRDRMDADKSRRKAPLLAAIG
jgi:diguanylate cyclase (GGDEF)-like protein/putative nucleotidyltransferase with HDIG domain